ncbi:MAG: hypothetical protein AB8B55_22035 [Mariniblastus sp.]
MATNIPTALNEEPSSIPNEDLSNREHAKKESSEEAPHPLADAASQNERQADSKNETSSALHPAWYFVSLILLGIYLTYFHLLNQATPMEVRFLGAGFAIGWMAVCFVAQSYFRNRFEFAIHTLVSADIVLESVVDSHSGYGFYFCAAAFWMVFWVYHHLPSRK